MSKQKNPETSHQSAWETMTKMAYEDSITIIKPIRRFFLLAMGGAALLTINPSLAKTASANLPLTMYQSMEDDEPTLNENFDTELGRLSVIHNSHVLTGDATYHFIDDLSKKITIQPIHSVLKTSSLVDNYTDPDQYLRLITVATLNHETGKFTITAGAGTPEQPFGNRFIQLRPLLEEEIDKIGYTSLSWKQGQLRGFHVFSKDMFPLPIPFVLRSIPTRLPGVKPTGNV